MIEQCERMSEQTSGRAQHCVVDFRPFLPRVQGWRTAGGSGSVDGGGAQWNRIALTRRVHFIEKKPPKSSGAGE